MTKVKRFCLALIFLIIVLPAGKSCYAGISSARHFSKKNLSDKLMIIDNWEIEPLVDKSIFMENVFDHMENQPAIAEEIKYVSSNSRRRNFRTLEWDLEIKDNTYHIFVNRYDKKVIVRGEAEDQEEKEKVEHIIELRAPDNFVIINKIEIYDKDLG